MTAYLLHNIGPRLMSNYNTLEEILALPMDAHLTFDGVYKNVWENRYALKGRSITLFIMGSFIGKDNTFDLDKVPRLEQYCDWNHIMDIVDATGAKLGWHTWNHLPLDALSAKELFRELKPPFPMESVAYPSGIVTPLVEGVAASLGFKEGYTVHQGDNSTFQRRRRYLNW